jgi:VIT1/CCC1 family predicted Fe2+/Mn2+ transporter
LAEKGAKIMARTIDLKWPIIGAVFASSWFVVPIFMWIDSIQVFGSWLAAIVALAYFIGGLVLVQVLFFGDLVIRIPLSKRGQK